MRWSPRYSLVFAFFTVVILLEVTLGHLGYAYANRNNPEALSWQGRAIRQAVSWYTFAALILPVIALVRRLPLDPGKWRPAWPVHLMLSLLFPVVSALTVISVNELLSLRQPGRPFLDAVGSTFAVFYGVDFLAYWGIVGVYSAFRYYELYKERELRTAKLERDLTAAELETLQTQLQPHFLFNTLNAVCGYALQRNHEGVVAMLTRLSDLLRALLQKRGSQLIPLSEELDFVRTYLEIQQMRLGERLSVRFSIEEAALNSRVPTLILQPLVENAISHGVAPRVNGGEITISAARVGERLRLSVEDDGRGVNLPGSPNYGIGLTTTRERLRHLFGNDHVFQLSERRGGGTVVLLEIPTQRGPSDQPLKN